MDIQRVEESARSRDLREITKMVTMALAVRTEGKMPKGSLIVGTSVGAGIDPAFTVTSYFRDASEHTATLRIELHQHKLADIIEATLRDSLPTIIMQGVDFQVIPRTVLVD